MIPESTVTLETVSRNMPGRTGKGLRPVMLAWRSRVGVKLMHRLVHKAPIRRFGL